MPRLIQAQRLLLRPLIEGDADAMHSMWAERDPRAVRRISADGHPTIEEMQARLRADLEESEATGIRLYGIEHTTSGLLGYCGLVVGRASASEPELAFELFQRFHGHGYATEASRAVVDAADTSGRLRLWSTVREWNTPSLRVLQKVGFERTQRSEPDDERGETQWWTRRPPVSPSRT